MTENSSKYIKSVNRTYQIHPMPNLRNILQLGSELNDADAMFSKIMFTMS